MEDEEATRLENVIVGREHLGACHLALVVAEKHEGVLLFEQR